MVHSGSKTVTNAGTRVALVATRTPAKWLIINAKQANTSYCIVGDKTVADGVGTTIAKTLAPVMFPPVSDLSLYDLSQIYVDAKVSGEGVEFNYGA